MNGRGNGTRHALGTLAIAASVALLASGCSPEIGFPSVHDMPAPRADATLTPDQVKQATDSLISEREHLSSETQTTTQSIPATKTAGKAATVASKKPSRPAPPPAQAAAAPASAVPAAIPATLTAGADSKP